VIVCACACGYLAASLEALPTSSVYGFEALGTDGIWHSTRKFG
jgi:hypothetical protein